MFLFYHSMKPRLKWNKIVLAAKIIFASPTQPNPLMDGPNPRPILVCGEEDRFWSLEWKSEEVMHEEHGCGMTGIACQFNNAQ